MRASGGKLFGKSLAKTFTKKDKINPIQLIKMGLSKS